MQFNLNQSRHRARLLAVLLPLLLLAGNGCKTLTQTASLPFNAMFALVPTTHSGVPDPAFIQTEELRFADSLFNQTASGLDEYSALINTPEVRLRALKWKVSLGSSIIDMATGPNPTANMLDLVTFATLMRVILEERAPAIKPPGSLDEWLEKSRALDTNGWMMAGLVLTTNQQQTLRIAIQRWREKNPLAKDVFFTRPEELTALIRESGRKDSKNNNIFNQDLLDPMAGLDPAVREVTRTRLFAERALFAAQRTSTLMRWQVELLTEQVMDQQQVVSALASMDRISRASESISQTAALIPDLIASERQAVITALEQQEGKLQELSTQVTKTLNAGNQMSDSLNTTLTTFNDLMKRFGVGEPSTNAPDTNSPPFNILDYAHTADQVANMAGQLDKLVRDANGTMDSPALDKRIADLGAVSTKTRDDAKSVLNHAFLLLAGLIILFFACLIIYRRYGRKGG